MSTTIVANPTNTSSRIHIINSVELGVLTFSVSIGEYANLLCNGLYCTQSGNLRTGSTIRGRGEGIFTHQSFVDVCEVWYSGYKKKLGLGTADRFDERLDYPRVYSNGLYLNLSEIASIHNIQVQRIVYVHSLELNSFKEFLCNGNDLVTKYTTNKLPTVLVPENDERIHPFKYDPDHFGAGNYALVYGYTSLSTQ